MFNEYSKLQPQKACGLICLRNYKISLKYGQISRKNFVNLPNYTHFNKKWDVFGRIYKKMMYICFRKQFCKQKCECRQLVFNH